MMSFLTQNINFLLTYFRINNIVTSIMATLLWKYSDLCVFLDDKYKQYYDNNQYFKLTMDYSHSMFGYFKRKLTTECVLPEENIWHKYISLIDNESTYTYSESFEILDNTISNETKYIESIELSKDFFNDSLNPNLCCLLSKFKDTYTVRNRYSNLEQSEYFQKSNVSILSVVYSHPKMEQKINIELPTEMLYCHNQLFNAAFVYFCLKYFNKEDFTFDEHYKVEIMDSNVEIINLTYNHYLHVGLDQLEVRVI